MKTRVVVNASAFGRVGKIGTFWRVKKINAKMIDWMNNPTQMKLQTGRVDSVNMHETGIHRFGYAQVCLRHSFAHK